MISAALRQEEGCPLPAAVVLRMEWMRRRLAIALRLAIISGDTAVLDTIIFLSG
jgi:PhoPQ-activated pathogenicity-related protein